MKKIIILLSVICLFSCQEEGLDVVNNGHDNIEKDFQEEGPIKCQEFTIGISWPITIETTVKYCCVGDWRVPLLALQCPNCGIVGNDGNDNKSMGGDLTKNKNTFILSNKINVTNLIKDKELRGKVRNKIFISKSTTFVDDLHVVNIKQGNYDVDKDGFIELKFKVKKRKEK